MQIFGVVNLILRFQFANLFSVINQFTLPSIYRFTGYQDLAVDLTWCFLGIIFLGKCLRDQSRKWFTN